MIKPLSDRILVKPVIHSEHSPGGIYQGMPTTTFVQNENKTKQVTVGEVLATGPGKYNKKGKRRPPDVPIGSIVCFSDTCGRPVDDLIFIREDDVIGFMDEATNVEVLYEETNSIGVTHES